MNEKYSKGLFIFFPAIAMMLGWGLRGHIGGGPMGAMIPGAMVALTICLLLELPAKMSALVVVFGVAGIGLGGEMTYGQTLGFLRDLDTVWWGILATTVKGAVWGVLGGIVLAMGFVLKNLSKKTIIVSFLVMMAGLFVGFKLINEPMLIYFSDPVKPRSESWGALLLGAVALITYLKFTITSDDFKIISRFASWGLIGGGLGFGIGGLWMVLGAQMPKGITFKAWWKAMELTFGFLLGGSLGYAAWLSKKELKANSKLYENEEEYSFKTSYKELGIMLLTGLLIYAIIPFSLEPFVDAASESDGFILTMLRSIARIFVNYAFYGLIMVAVVLYFPKAAWQIGITLTFCHTVIDLADDHLVEIFTNSPVVASLLSILITSLVVGFIVAYYQGKTKQNRNMFLILTWSTVFISTFKIIFYPQKLNLAGQSFNEIVFGLFVVDIAFLMFAVIVTWMAFYKVKAL
jgi:hypothetical protein